MTESGRSTALGRRRFLKSLRGMAADRRGVAAVEFALLVPLLMILYFLTMEASQAIDTSKKVSRAASMTADLITQQPTITADELAAMMEIGTALLQPYNRTPAPTITATGIQMDNTVPPKATVLWSKMLGPANAGCPLLKKADIVADVPTQIKAPGTFLVKVQSCLPYSPVLTWTAGGGAALGPAAPFGKIPMGDTYYLRPRVTDVISCPNC